MPKHIIVTGTSRGIGLELVKFFAEKGHIVLALSRNTKPVKALNFSTVHPLAFDITKEENHKVARQYIAEHWPKIDVLIHNAGQIVKDAFENIQLADLKRVYNTNVFGVFGLTQTLLPLMEKDSHIVVVSSMGGIQGSVKFPGLTAYSSSKAAVINLMEVLAEEYKATGPVFNALALGAVQTEMFSEAFPGAQAGTQPQTMAEYIGQFALTGYKVYNGKVLSVSNSTP